VEPAAMSYRCRFDGGEVGITASRMRICKVRLQTAASRARRSDSARDGRLPGSFRAPDRLAGEGIRQSRIRAGIPASLPCSGPMQWAHV
jgi:hypothetical protein